MSKRNSHVQGLLDNFIDVAQFDLEFSNEELLQAIVRHHERYIVDFPDDDPENKLWRTEVIGILKRAIKELDALG